MSRKGRVRPEETQTARGELRGWGRGRREEPPAASGSFAVVASLKTNKGEDAEAGEPETGKAVVIKESERFGDEDRESARQGGRERNSVPCAQQ